ncbi:MAG: YqaA family protein [Candidatus Methanoperedens sp.]
MLQTIESVLLNYGYSGLFTASFLASTILPFGSEGFLVYLTTRGFNVMSLVLVATIGNFLGACTSYYIGLKGGGYAERILKMKPGEIEKAEKYFSKYGSYVLLFTWLPLIGDVFTVVSGILRFRFAVFTVLVFTGKFLRYLAVVYLAGALIS